MSEFGRIGVVKTADGGYEDVSMHLMSNRLGMEICGFASAKYYEDTENPTNPVHEKGRIKVMPRLIVGYPVTTSRILAEGKPGHQFKSTHSGKEYQAKRQRYMEAQRSARWCSLLECQQEASDLHYMMEHLTLEDTKWMDPNEYDTARRSADAMNRYFTKALATAMKKADADPREAQAMKDAQNNFICRAVIKQSHNTYIGDGVERVEDDPTRRPLGAREDDLSELSDWTLSSIASGRKTDLDDRLIAQAEIARRKRDGTFNPDLAPEDIGKDLATHGYEIRDGRILYPSREYKEWLQSGSEGEISDKALIHQTISERVDEMRQDLIEQSTYANRWSQNRSSVTRGSATANLGEAS